MPRPMKWRRIEHIPEVKRFVPVGKQQEVFNELQLKIEELEAMRLKDIIGLNQAECAERMNVSRQTFQLIIEKARKKVAMALTQGYGIHITGGNYTYNICEYKCEGCGHVFKQSYEEQSLKCPKCDGEKIVCTDDEQFCENKCRKRCCQRINV